MSTNADEMLPLTPVGTPVPGTPVHHTSVNEAPDTPATGMSAAGAGIISVFHTPPLKTYREPEKLIVPPGLAPEAIKKIFIGALSSKVEFYLLTNLRPPTPDVPPRSIYTLKALEALVRVDAERGHTRSLLDVASDNEFVVRYLVDTNMVCVLGFAGCSKTGSCTHPWLNDMGSCYASGDINIRLIDGKPRIKVINNESGHYRSGFDSIRAIILVLLYNPEYLDDSITLVNYQDDSNKPSVVFTKGEILKIGQIIQKNFPHITVPEQLDKVITKPRVVKGKEVSDRPIISGAARCLDFTAWALAPRNPADNPFQVGGTPPADESPAKRLCMR